MKLVGIAFVIALVLIPCLSLSSNCGGNCLSEKCGECHCGLSPNPVNITAMCQQFPGWDEKCCKCVVNGSKGNANAEKEREDGTSDVGLWQINSNEWAKCSGGTAPCSAQGNMDCAIGIWKRNGGSFKAWDNCESCGCCKSTALHGYKVADTIEAPTKVPMTSIKTPKRKSVIHMEPAKNITVPETNCGGNCPSSDCSSCPCGSSPSSQDIPTWCSKFSGWDQTCCKCIVQHESGGNANAVNENTNGSFDVGLWQINSVNWPACNGGSAPCDTNANLKCAQQIWGNGGNSFAQWSTCGACGCCASTTGGPATHATNGPATHATNGPATHATHATNGPATHATNGPSTTSSSSSTYGAAFYESNQPYGGHGNLPLVDIKNVIFNKKK